MKKVLMLHGLGGEADPVLSKVINMFGCQTEFPQLDFAEEWYYDKCKYLVEAMAMEYKDVDVIIGLSLGGYLGFILANHLNKPCILINPSVNRAKSKLAIRNFDFKFELTNPETEVFFGDLDDVVPNENTTEYFDRIQYEYTPHIVKGMEHGFDIYEFIYILRNSKILQSK